MQRSSLTPFERVTLNPAGDPVACECACAQSNKSFLHVDFFLPNTCIPNAAEIWKTVPRVWWVCSPVAASSCYRWWSRGRERGREGGSKGEDGTHAVGEEPLHCKRQKINSHAFTPTGNYESDRGREREAWLWRGRSNPQRRRNAKPQRTH